MWFIPAESREVCWLNQAKTGLGTSERQPSGGQSEEQVITNWWCVLQGESGGRRLSKWMGHMGAGGLTEGMTTQCVTFQAMNNWENRWQGPWFLCWEVCRNVTSQRPRGHKRDCVLSQWLWQFLRDSITTTQYPPTPRPLGILFLLLCPSSVLYWESLTMLTIKETFLMEFHCYYRANIEGCIWSWEVINWHTHTYKSMYMHTCTCICICVYLEIMSLHPYFQFQPPSWLPLFSICIFSSCVDESHNISEIVSEFLHPY